MGSSENRSVTPPPVDADDAASRAAAADTDAAANGVDETDFDAVFAQEVADAQTRDFTQPSTEPDEDDEDVLNDVLTNPTVDEDATPIETRAQRRASAAAKKKAADEAKAAKDAEAQAAAAATTETTAAAPTTQPATEQPAPKTYAPTETFALGVRDDGTEVAWPREHILGAINERAVLIERDKKWQQAMGTTLESAEQNWAPLTAAIKKNPLMGVVLQDVADSFINDPERADYLRDALTYYDEKKGRAPRNAAATTTQPAQPAIDPETAKRIENLERSLATRSQRETAQRVQSEVAQVTARYPVAQPGSEALKFLARVTRDVVLSGRDPNYNLIRAAEDNRDYLNFLASQRSGGAAPAAAAPARPVAPALAGSSGAAPAGGRRAPDMNPRTFATADDAISDWERNRSQYGFQ